MEVLTPEPVSELDRCWFVQRATSVYHSGDLGDIIYSMLWCKMEFGMIDLVLGPDTRWELRCQMDRRNFEFITPLLEIQPWIKSVSFSQTIRKCDFCLNDFRHTWFSGKRRSSRLFEAYAEHFRTGPLPENVPWLSVSPRRIPSKPIIVNRSARYQNPAFPWGVIARTYANRIGFVGLPAEHLAWTRNFGSALYIPVKNALEMAEIIAGASLFIGNQSLGMSLALALGVPLIQEVGHPNADCIMKRPNAFYYEGGPLNLPPMP